MTAGFSLTVPAPRALVFQDDQGALLAQPHTMEVDRTIPLPHTSV